MAKRPGVSRPAVPPPGGQLGRIRKLWLAWLWSAPEQKYSRSGLFQSTLQILAIAAREFERNLLLLRAGVLTLTIVFALVPTLALGTAVLKGLHQDNQLRQAAYLFIAGLEPHAATNPPPAPGDLGSHLQQAVDQILAYVEQTDFTTLGVFGVGGLLLSILGLLGSIDQAMNAIWHLPSRRRFTRQLLKYLALVLLLPLSVNLALAVETTLQSPTALAWLLQIPTMAWASKFLLHLMPTLLLILTLTTLYRLLPNARVGLLPALIGGISGTFSWLGSQALYLKLQLGVARYNAIYGSFATVPLFLLWLLLGWLVFLAGAQITYAVQHRQQYRNQRSAPTAIAKLALLCQILLLAGQDREQHRGTSVASLAARLPATKEELGQLIADLAHLGLLRRMAGKGESYLPTRESNELDPTLLLALLKTRHENKE